MYIVLNLLQVLIIGVYCITQELKQIKDGIICKSQSAPSILGPHSSSQLKQQIACVHPIVCMPLHSQLNLTQTQCEVSNNPSIHVI